MASARSLPLRHRVGQLMIFGFDGLEITPRLHRMLQTIAPGGVILFARNIADPQQTCMLLADALQIMKIEGNQTWYRDKTNAAKLRFSEDIRPLPFNGGIL